MKTILATLIILSSFNCFAFEKEDSSLSLREALLASNKDYNTHKKEMLEEENQRIDHWGERNVQAINVESDILVEGIGEAVVEPSKKDANRVQAQEMDKTLHEISMNN